MGVDQEGYAQLKVALPSPHRPLCTSEETHQMSRVVIGMDPHKRSATIEVIDERELDGLFQGFSGRKRSGIA
ncbi:hypothetical protein GCM10009827_117250 [Dactylosporangium maewongense]|uniref:Transposase n=1 Tax=Dactylosporangium maewongense TaxID=634393 RepID=A0ABN2DGT3_9ACTN